MMGKLAWGKKVDQPFRDEVFRICNWFKWPAKHADYLMACMAFESGETFSPSIRNFAGSGATGLIQFMPATARGLGTTTDALAAMSAVDQLKYVKWYFRPYYTRINSLSDMYMAILMPKYVGQKEEAIIFHDGTTAYRQNSGLDANKDGLITKAEATSMVQAKLEKGLLPGYALEF